MTNANNPENQQKQAARGSAVQIIAKPFEVWIDYATTEEKKLASFAKVNAAYRWMAQEGKYHGHADRLDVIKRQQDGTLKTDF